MKVLLRTLLAFLVLSQPALAKGRNKRTIKAAAQTGAGAARDGVRTLGRTIRSFFNDGPDAAKATWKANARLTKKNARSGGRETKRQANSK